VFVAPAGVPAGPLERLRTALRESIADPEVQAALRKAGVEEIGAIPVERVTEAMRADQVKWGEVIRRANITIDG
jgi:tripartite-type tricarboxylate transporter receptor subunit TctC